MALQLTGLDEGAPMVRIDGADLYLDPYVVPLCEMAGDIEQGHASSHALVAIFQFTLDQSGIGARLCFEGRLAKTGEEVRTGWMFCCIPRRIEMNDVITFLGDEEIFTAEMVVPVALGLATAQSLRKPVTGALHARLIDVGMNVSCAWDDSRETLITTVCVGNLAEPDLELVFRFPRGSVKETFGLTNSRPA